MQWSPALAYVIGIITADGNLSPSGRHINITSKDEEIVQNCKQALGINNKIGRKARGSSDEKKYFVLQFGSVIFYKFLLDIGLCMRKSKTLEKVSVPDEYFAHFLRGVVDGDGSINTCTHPESNHPQLRLGVTSASPPFLTWLHRSIHRLTNVRGGWIYTDKRKSVSTLTFGKCDTILLGKFMYNSDCTYRLTRKYKRIQSYL